MAGSSKLRCYGMMANNVELMVLYEHLVLE